MTKSVVDLQNFYLFFKKYIYFRKEKYKTLKNFDVCFVIRAFLLKFLLPVVGMIPDVFSL